MARPGKLTDKDMSVYREADQARTQKAKAFGVLRDHTMQHTVSMRWDLNDEAMRDQIFILKVDDLEVMLDTEQVMRYLRWV